MSVYSERGEKLKKENKAAVEEQTAAKKDELDIQVDQQIQSAEQKVSAGIADADARYRDVVDTAAVQRELDRRQIQETMANMGLGRSGLNATQQTAVQLSAGNKMAAASLQRQAAVDSLKQSLAEYKMASEDARRQGKMELDESAQKEIAAFDASVDKGVSEAESAEYKAKQEAEAKKYEADMKASELQYKAIADEQERMSKNNQKVLDKMLEGGELTPALYARATENGWSYTYAKDFEKADARIARGQFADKDEAIAFIYDSFPSDGDKNTRAYFYNRVGITQKDLDEFFKNYAPKTTK